MPEKFRHLWVVSKSINLFKYFDLHTLHTQKVRESIFLFADIFCYFWFRIGWFFLSGGYFELLPHGRVVSGAYQPEPFLRASVNLMSTTGARPGPARAPSSSHSSALPRSATGVCPVARVILSPHSSPHPQFILPTTHVPAPARHLRNAPPKCVLVIVSSGGKGGKFSQISPLFGTPKNEGEIIFYFYA